MVITEEIKDLVSKAPYIAIVTVSAQGDPHPIAVAKVAEIREGDVLSFEIYKMVVTQQNIRSNGKMQVIIATMDGGPKGFRLTGKASIEEKLVLFKVEKTEALL